MAEAITIKDVQTILTQPAGSRLVIVKIITSEPGLYGLGCATFTQRVRAVHAAIDQHLKPFLIGRDVEGLPTPDLRLEDPSGPGSLVCLVLYMSWWYQRLLVR